MNVTQGLRRILQVNPLGLGTVDGDRHRTWREVGERVARLASALHRLGIQRGDRVAVLMLNSDRYLELYLGIAWAGAVIVPTNIRWSHAEIEDSLHDCRASMLVVDKAFAAMGEALAKSVGLTLVYADDDAAPSGALHYETLIEQTDPIPDAMADREDLAGIFYTGGTTGRSKGVMLSHANLVSNALNMLAEGLLPEGSVYLNAAPMFHLANGAGMFCSLIGGGTNVVIRSFTPEGVMNAIARNKVSVTLLVPTMIQMFVDHPGIGNADLTSLKRIMYGASPISEALLNRAIAALPGTAFDQLYGMNDKFEPVPQMAQGHVVENDGLLWRFTLREGLKFHDGTPVRGRDCIASIKRWGRRDAFGQELMARVADMTEDSDRVFTIKLNRPFAKMLEAFSKVTTSCLFIMPERLANVDPFTNLAEAVGSGPYRFVQNEWVPGSSVVYARNPDYVPVPNGTPSMTAGPKVVHFDRVEWRIIPDASTAAAFSGTLALTPMAPPPERVSVVLLVSSVVVCVRTTWPSGSYFSAEMVVASVSMSAETRTTAWPGPMTWASIVSTLRPR